MILVNIITDTPQEKRYVSESSEFENNGIFCFYENSSKKFIWDIVIIYERVIAPVEVNVKKGGLWFISGEPPFSREYPKEFLRMFDIQITSHHYSNLDNVVNDQQALDWWYSKSFETKRQTMTLQELEDMKVPIKTKNISIISSSKKMMPGHNYRQNIIKHLKSDFPGQIDFYGGVDGNIDLKKEAIDPYRFSICIENSSVDDYWTEKLADSFLGYTIPIYSGCTNISKYFDNNGMYTFDIKEYSSLKSIISEILLDSILTYNKKYDELASNRQLLFQKYHLFKQVAKYYYNVNKSQESANRTIRPMSCYRHYKLITLWLRARRLLFKSIYSIMTII